MAVYPHTASTTATAAAPTASNAELTATTWTAWAIDVTNSSTTAASVTVWTTWNYYFDTGGAVHVELAGQVWDSWTRSHTITTTRAAGATLDDVAHARAVIEAQQQLSRPTQEQLERWKREEAERRQREAEAARKRLDARARARDLLVGCLTPQQKEDLEKKKCFFLECHSKDGSKRRYRIDEGTHGNVKLLDDKDRVVGQYCVQPDGVPTEDAMLAQKLWLETNEEGFQKAANFTRYR